MGRLAADELPPCDNASEKAVLGAMLGFPERTQRLCEKLNPQDFYSTQNRKIFLRICDLHSRETGIDVITLSAELRQHEELDEVGGVIYLTELSNCAFSPENARYHAEIIRENANKRRCIELAHKLDATARNGFDQEVVEAIAAQLQDLRNEPRQNAWRPELLSSVIAKASAIEWLIGDWFAKGHVTLLAGAPKVGKSILSFTAMLALTHSGCFLGEQVSRCRVLYLSGEDGAPILKDRVEIMRASAGDMLVSFGGQEISPRFLRTLRTTIRNEGIGALFIDPLIRFHAIDENSSDVARPIYQLRELAQELGIATWVVHHLRKSVGEYGSDIRGSTSLLGAVDIAVTTRRVQGEEHRVAAEFVGRICRRTEPIVLTLEEGLKWSPVGLLKDIQRNDAAQQILQALEDGEKSFDEIQEITEIPQSTLRRHLKHLEESGKIECQRTAEAGGRGKKTSYHLKTVSPA